MMNFEETFNRWIDGRMEGRERDAFEAGLDPELLRGGKSWPLVREELRSVLRSTEVPHAEFLTSRIMAEIRPPAAGARASERGFLWMVWAGAACVAVAALLSAAFLPRGGAGSRLTTVVSAEPLAPGSSASAFQVRDGSASVIWMDGLDYIPGGEQVR